VEGIKQVPGQSDYPDSSANNGKLGLDKGGNSYRVRGKVEGCGFVFKKIFGVGEESRGGQ
jgi:hypothetical protein